MKTKNGTLPGIQRLAVKALLLCLFTGIGQAGFATGDGGIEDAPVTAIIAGSPLVQNSILLTSGAIAPVHYDYKYESDKKIRNMVTLSLFEESTDFIPASFTATVKVRIQYGHDLSALNTIDRDLTIDYNKAGGGKYNARNYFSFSGAEYVNVTILQITAPMAGNLDTKKLLIVQNEMRVTRYFILKSGVLPSFTAPAPSAADDDEVNVSWGWPQDAGHTHTQLEWTWVEDDLLEAYKVNGVINDILLFKNSATRLDLPRNRTSYAIPLLYGGEGKLYYRIRAVNIKDDSRSDGPWSVRQEQLFKGHQNSLNWQSTASYAEDGKRKVVVQYYDGSLRSRQTVTKENSTGKTISSETLYDGQGRPAIQILPVPSLNNKIGYTKNLNLFNSNAQLNLPAQQENDDPSGFFDLQPLATATSITPSLNTAYGSSLYYSSANTKKEEGANKNIPDAEGYPYTVTRYTPDATGRIMAQSGVGAAMRMGFGHETKYYYGSPSQEELDGLFGTEAGNAAHYFKNMVRDANGQMSVSYVDMHGRTIATALAGETPPNLKALDRTTADYPAQDVNGIIRNLLNPASNVQKNNSIESVGTLLVPVATLYSFVYKLTPEALQLPSATSPQWCYDCMYNLEISITDESGDVPPVVRSFSNISLSADDDCATAPGAFTTGTWSNGPNSIKIDETLQPGSYSVRKTLTLSEASLQRYKDMYVDKAQGKSEQQLTDSIYNVLQTVTGCSTAAPATCAACRTELGTEEEFKARFLASLGNPAAATVSQEVLDEISAAYAQARLNCDRLCNTTSQTLASKRAMMLADMMPYSGQYAKETGSGTMFGKYNIFSAVNPSGEPFYKNPLDKYSAPDFYRTPFHTVDLSIHPGNLLVKLKATGKDEFAAGFNNSWAESLLPYHPEYGQLLFAEDKLTPSYDWITTFNNTSTYADALSKGYIFTSENNITDPFYSGSPAPDPNAKVQIANYIKGVYKNPVSMWQIAYGDARCKNIVNLLQRRDCYENAPKTPPYANLTTAEQDQVWRLFRNLYSMERETQVNQYINANRPSNDAATLVTQGYILQFPTSGIQMAQQFGNAQTGIQGSSDWSWFPPVPGGDPITAGAATPAQVLAGRCSSYIDQWKQALLQCPAILNHPSREQILSAITTGMTEVCKKGIDEANPYGSSNVAPSTPVNGLPRSFEEVINAVLLQYGIAKTDLCNPFVIEFPKPYGKGPVFTKNMIALVDSCHCDRLSALKGEAATAGYNPASLSSFNEYLNGKYGETITQNLFDQMNLNCGQTSAVCRDTVIRTKLLWEEPMPCGCTRTADPNDAESCFQDCPIRSCETRRESFALTAPQPMPEYLKCGFDGGQRCLDCSQLSGLVAEFRQKLPAPYNAGPVFGGADLDEATVNANILFARFVNYRTGFRYSWMQYANAAGAAGCSLAAYSGNAGAHQNVICGDVKPLGDAGGIFTEQDPCERAHNMAAYLAQEIYNKRKEQKLAGFEAAYRAKCMTVQEAEQFTVAYENKEYHYTLYYYDMAGNLVKTVPPKGVRPDFSKAYTDGVEADKLSGAPNPRPHLLVTNYRYNSLNGVVAQNSPDANTSLFWYDKLGRLAVSRNAQQELDGKYSYTLYDELGRITEVGQKPQPAPMGQATSQDPVALEAWIITGGGTREQLTYTAYDVPYGYSTANPNGILSPQYITQQNLRNRVSYTATKKLATDVLHDAATFYTYDIHGNVDVLLQDYKGVAEMDGSGNRFKLISYDYDLISGKVNAVSYQPGKNDAFYHRYSYDAENRLTEVYTSRDRLYWERDAAYSYYRHGPLARTELGQLRVQGTDYVYTLQGWLKGVNPGASVATTGSDGTCEAGTAPDDLVVTSRVLNTPAKYIARNSITFDGEFNTPDGDAFETELNGSLAACVPGGGSATAGTPFDEAYPAARDAYSFSLNYYAADYKAISPAAAGFVDVLTPLGVNAASLYNGNIAAMAVNLAKINKPLVYSYHYDQLNRLVNMEAYTGLTNSGFTLPGTVPTAYKEQVTYDPNGNIMTYKRNGDVARLSMDDMTYHYKPSTNQLDKVVDAAPDAGADYDKYRDIKQGQTTGNYTYDAIGNLTSDVSEGLTAINWSVYGKILSIVKNGNTVSYSYDAGGNRISKRAGGTTTVYVRDASGNVMSVYEKTASTALQHTEVHLYGSSRLGMVKGQSVPPVSDIVLAAGYAPATLSTYTRNEKSFELSNHLGNVLVTVSDKRTGVDVDNNGTVDYYEGDVVSAQDYYPGGMQMPGRQYTLGNGYRYGFNGKEKDEADGVVQYDYGFRIYDPRIVRFKSVDPLTKSYPFYTPYQFAANMPIAAIDLDGAEAKVKLNWGTVTKDRAAIEISADVNIKVQIINLSSTSSFKMDLEQVASNLKSDLEDKLSGQHTAIWDLPFVFKSKSNTITDVEMAKTKKDFKNTSVTYNTSVSAQVSVVDDMSKIDNNTWVFAIVDKVKTSDGKDWGGMAYGIGAGKVAIGTAESFLPKNLEKHGRNTAFHEIAHLLGANDTYPPNTEIYPGTQTSDNLMYGGNGLNLTPDQIVREIWQATIGTIQKVFKERVKDYKQPSDPSYSQPSQDQLKQHIQNYGAKN